MFWRQQIKERLLRFLRAQNSQGMGGKPVCGYVAGCGL
jgi:hypothetical protein